VIPRAISDSRARWWTRCWRGSPVVRLEPLRFALRRRGAKMSRVICGQ
jgi:hypothetical protein